MATSDIYNQQMAVFDNSAASGSGNYGGWNFLTGQGDALATTNAFTAQQAALANQFSHDEAALNRNFQERMSNTQYQRAFADMKAAGINPLNLGGIDGASVAATSAGQAHQGSGANPGQNGFTGFLVGLLRLGASLASSGASAAASSSRDATNLAIASLSNDAKKDIAFNSLGRKDLRDEINRMFRLLAHLDSKPNWTKNDTEDYYAAHKRIDEAYRKLFNHDYL